MEQEVTAKSENTVRKLYQDDDVASNYIQDRFQWSWSRLLHETQVGVLNELIARERFESILEVAPGPARLTTCLEGVRSGVLVEGSEQMVEVARRRLEEAGKAASWDLRCGNAFELDRHDELFDCVFTFRFIRHFDAADRTRLYEQIWNRLRPGGFLVFDAVNRVVRERLDRAEGKAQGELDVYDVTYSPEELREELAAAGFQVESLRDTIRHMTAQAWVSHKLDRRIPALSRGLVRALESVPSAQPLEWVVICRKVERRD